MALSIVVMLESSEQTTQIQKIDLHLPPLQNNTVLMNAKSHGPNHMHSALQGHHHYLYTIKERKTW